MIDFDDQGMVSEDLSDNLLSSSDTDSSEEEDIKWEDVSIDRIPEKATKIDVTIEDSAKSTDLIKSRGISVKSRQIRLDTHCMHVKCLLAHAALRNYWLRDKELQIILQNQALRDHKLNEQLSLFLTSDILPRPSSDISSRQIIYHLGKWWSKRFKVSKNGLRRVGYVDSFDYDWENLSQYQAEEIDSLDHLKHIAKINKGSKDVAAQLFTALVRSFGIEVRLVFSLPCLGVTFKEYENCLFLDQKPKEISGGFLIEENPKEKIKRVKSRTYVSQEYACPLYWIEFYCLKANKWIPYDPIVSTRFAFTEQDIEEIFDSKGKNSALSGIIHSYIIAFDGSGFAKDVTARYVRSASKRKSRRMEFITVKLGQNKGIIEIDPFKSKILHIFTNKTTTEKDVKEDEELNPKTDVKVKTGPKLNTLAFYKNHSTCILKRSLKRDETLIPCAKPIKHLKAGTKAKPIMEEVYSISDVVKVKSIETYMREGKVVRKGEVPLKEVKARAVTLNKKREHAQYALDNDAIKMQPLFAEYQTEFYIPPPIVNGIVPKNSFGNIDLYVPHMLPEGGTHLPLKGSARIAKKLGIDFADAICDFEFKNQRAIPITMGIVVATENAQRIEDEWTKYENERIEKQRKRIETENVALWRRLINGILIKERLESSYGKLKG